MSALVFLIVPLSVVVILMYVLAFLIVALNVLVILMFVPVLINVLVI